MEVKHGLAGWGCFRRLPETSAGLRSDDGADSLSDAGSPVAAADLRLAELRSVSEIPRAAGFPRVLAGKARGTAVLRHGSAFAADQAGRAAGGEWGFPAALIRLRSCELRRDGPVGWAKRSVPTCLAPERVKVGTAQAGLSPTYKICKFPILC